MSEKSNSTYIDYGQHDGGRFSETIFEEDYPSHSKLLDANGNPIPYKINKIKLGFDLTCKKK